MGRRREQRSKKPRAQRKSRLGLWIALALAILIGSYVWVLDFSRPHVTGDDLRYDQFLQAARDEQVDSARILDVDAYVVGSYERDDGTTGVYNAPLVRGKQAGLADELADLGIPTSVDQQVTKRVVVLASYLLPTLILILLFSYLILSYRRGTGLFAMGKAGRRIEPGEANVRFADVAGQAAAVAELREIKEFLADPQRFIDIGAQVPKGVLLYGPPGCGKTLLAKALAGEAGAAFYSASGSDFVEMYVGVGAGRVRALFQEARENAPALIFIDELDAIGRARGIVGTTASHGEQEQTLNQILAEMDGFDTSEGIIVVAATNRADILDQALLRPGRFDRTVGLERPDEAARLAVLQVHARGKRLAADVDLAAIASRAIGMTGADLASVMNEGALLAARDHKLEIGQRELLEAVERILEAPERQKRLSLRERSIGKRYSSRDRITFADVAGVDEAVAELTEVRDYLADPDRFAAIGARVPRGILLAGPPGVGKTLLARAVAGEANAAFISVAGSEFVEIFVGEGASRVRELFAEARATAPAIVFIDEIDAIGSRRTAGVSDGGRERENTLNQILVELDGFTDRAAVIVMAATNRPDMLDPALIRPGRFDRQVSVSPPDRAGRAEILTIHAAGKRLADDAQLDVVAGLTRGFSGADLANVMNEAALLAARHGQGVIDMTHLEEAIDRARLGVASRVTVMTDDERRVIAHHEAGHAIAALRLPHAEPPHKLTIVSRGAVLGNCQTVDSHDRLVYTRAALLDRIAVSLAGGIAEELVFGERTAGSESDLAAADDIAHRMVRRFGMAGGLVPRSYPDVDRDGNRRQYSADRLRQLDAAVDELLAEAATRAREALSATVLDRVAAALLERETLDLAQLEELVATTPITASKRPGKPRSAASKPARTRS